MKQLLTSTVQQHQHNAIRYDTEISTNAQKLRVIDLLNLVPVFFTARRIANSSLSRRRNIYPFVRPSVRYSLAVRQNEETYR